MSKKPTLVIPVGLPRAGKSTWALKQNHPVVSPDAIRLAMYGEDFRRELEDWVWMHAKLMVKALFKTGYNVVILDATNTRKVQRDDWKSDDWQRKFYIFDTPVDVCKQRASDTNKPELVSVIEIMAKTFEPVSTQELLPGEMVREDFLNPITN